MAEEAGAGTSVTANGYVVARTRASVSAKLAGRIADLRVSEGSTLERGEIIATLENADYEAQAAQAKAARGHRAGPSWSRRGRRARSRRGRRPGSADMRRENADLVSEQDLDNVEGRASQAAARLEAAEARLAAAEASRRFALANLENTVIRAPFSGTVLRKEAEIGEVVAPSVGGGLTRGAVVTMADLTTLEVEVDVNEAYIARVQQGRAGEDHARRLSRHRLPRRGPAGGAHRRPAASHGAGQGEHPRPRSAHPAGDGRAGGFPGGLGRRGPRRGRTRRAAEVSACPPRPCARRTARASSGWCGTAGSSRARCRRGRSAPASGRSVSGLAGGERLLVGGVEKPEAGMRVSTVSGVKGSTACPRFARHAHNGESSWHWSRFATSTKSSSATRERIEIFTGLTLDIAEGSFTALMGPVRLGQVHPAQPARRARQADQRHHHGWPAPR